MAGLELLLVANADDLYVRDVLKQGTHRVHRRTAHRLLHLMRLHHVVKVASSVKWVKGNFTQTPLSAIC